MLENLFQILVMAYQDNSVKTKFIGHFVRKTLPINMGSKHIQDAEYMLRVYAIEVIEDKDGFSCPCTLFVRLIDGSAE